LEMGEMEMDGWFESGWKEGDGEKKWRGGRLLWFYRRWRAGPPWTRGVGGGGVGGARRDTGVNT
jgi:hypothetical protein